MRIGPTKPSLDNSNNFSKAGAKAHAQCLHFYLPEATEYSILVQVSACPILMSMMIIKIWDNVEVLWQPIIGANMSKH